MKRTTVTVRRPWRYPRLFLAYGPGPTLVEEARWTNWRKWNGLAFRIGNRLTFLEAR